VREQEEQGHLRAELRQKREELRAELATVLGCDAAAATLGELARRLPGEPGVRLGRERQRLLGLAAQLERANGELAGLVYHSLAFLNGVVLDLGGSEASEGYGRAGRPEPTRWGPVLEARV
jgi:hypothetical protein